MGTKKVRGVVCPRCGGPMKRVTETRDSARGMVTRRRECRGCGHRVTTDEKARPK